MLQIQDGSVARLYPKQDNYVNEGDGGRSPKSLSALCVDAVCRSLPNLDGNLPAGLPQDVVDDIIGSLMRHAALNATTLRVLKNCELGKLELCGESMERSNVWRIASKDFSMCLISSLTHTFPCQIALL